MGTALEHLGANLNNSLWTARVLLDQPELVKRSIWIISMPARTRALPAAIRPPFLDSWQMAFRKKKPRILIVRSVKVFQEARNEWWEKKARPRTAPIPCV